MMLIKQVKGRVEMGQALRVLSGLEEKVNSRENALKLGIAKLAQVGPLKFELKEISKEAGLTPSMFNYYFKNRDLFIQECAITAYADYVEQMVAITKEYSFPAKDRLKKWISFQIKWTTDFVGIAMVLNYPNLTISKDVSENVEFSQSLRENSTRNLEHLGRLILEIYKIDVSEDSKIESIMAKNPLIAMQVGHIGWLAFGISNWVAGSHSPTRYLQETDFDPRKVIDPLINEILKFNH